MLKQNVLPLLLLKLDAHYTTGQHGGAQHHEDGGEAHEGPAVQQGQQRALPGEEEAGAAERQERARGRGQGVQGRAEEAVHDQREREAQPQVGTSCEGQAAPLLVHPVTRCLPPSPFSVWK